MREITGRRWTKEEHDALVRLADGSLPAALVAKKLGRSHQSVQSYARRNGISLAGYWSKKKK